VTTAVVVLVVFTVLAVVWLHSAWREPAVRQIGIQGDPQVFAWFFGWFPWAISHGHNPIITYHLMAPGGANLLASTSVPLASVALWPVTAAFGPVVSYNTLATMVAPLTGWSAFLVCRRFTASIVASAAAGLLYGFSPYMQAKTLSHMNLAIAVFPVFVLAMLHEVLIVQRRSPYRMGVLLGAGTAAELLLSSDLLAMTAIMSGVFAAVLILFGRTTWRARAPNALRGLATAAAVSLVLGGAFAAIQIFGPRHVSGLVQPRDTFVSDLVGIFLPSKFQAVSTHDIAAHARHLSGDNGEFSTYLGVPLLVVLAVAYWRGRRRRVMQIAGTMFLVAFILSLGGVLHVDGHKLPVPLPWAAVSHVPFIENILPSRFILFAYLAAAVMLALFIEDVSRSAARPTRLLAVGALAVTAVSLWPELHPPSTRVTAPPFFTTAAIRQIPEGAVVAVAPTHASSIVPMVWQLKADFRFLMPEGAAFTPDGWGFPNTPLFIVINVIEGDLPRTIFAIPEACRDVPISFSDECLALTRADLRGAGVRAIVLGPATHAPDLRRFFTNLVGASPKRTSGVDLWLVEPVAAAAGRP
jgi:hypothetical protein